MRWAEHVTYTGKIKKCIQNSGQKKPQINTPLRKPSTKGSRILKWILEKQGVKL